MVQEITNVRAVELAVDLLNLHDHAKVMITWWLYNILCKILLTKYEYKM